MISICIPIYNFNISSLINDLTSQVNNLDVPCEIILIDDCSLKIYQEKNQITNEKIRYVLLNKNIGRAKIRNLFLKYAKYENLIFLDCDSLIIDQNFINNYLDVIKENKYDVICGGRIYDKKKPPNNQLLSWKYGLYRESKMTHSSAKKINKAFMTNNFAITKKTLEEVCFDESITKYGHEDTLFGFMLKKNNKTIKYVNNPVLNGNIETNSNFLSNTERGIQNLSDILEKNNYDPDFIKYVKILTFYNKLKLCRMSNVYNVFFYLSKPLLKSMLISGFFASLFIFDIYKLGVLVQLQKNKKQ